MSLPEPRLASSDRGTACVWRLRLLGAVELRRRDGSTLRLPTRAATALLALLALSPQRAHPREELIDRLWPGVALDVGRNRLRQTLSTLKQLLETDGERIIDADRSTLRLRPGSVDCDAVAFTELVQRGAHPAARDLHGGELMPGFYDEWVLDSRRRLDALFERVETRLAESPRPAQPPDDPLPASWTRAFGIESQVSHLMDLVRRERLVCVAGPGGCGKTRLCLETARALRDARNRRPQAEPATHAPFARIVFVPLADCRDEAQTLDALARAVHAIGPDPLAALMARLAGLPVLLVLDNFEQLVTPAAGLLLRLLEALPGLHLLVSSRQRLGLPGEIRSVLGGLPVPPTDADAAALARNPAVALFVDRARAAHPNPQPDTWPDDTTLASVASLARLLDGMPLALELAASRAATHPPAQLVAVLGSGLGDAYLPLLSRQAPRAGHDPRHASIEQVIDWSWGLARAAEQRLLAALSCFAGDASLAALAAVLGDSPARVATSLDELAGHSLLTVVPAASASGSPRYALVEPVREFVRSRWPSAARQQLQLAQWRWLLAWAGALGPGAGPATVKRELCTLLSALGHADEAPTQALSLALALRPHWESAGMPAATQQALSQALAIAEAGVQDAALLSAGHELLAYLRFEAGLTSQAMTHAESALRHAGANGPLRARALVRRAWLDLSVGRSNDATARDTTPAQAWLDEALALARTHGDREGEARALHQLAVLASRLHDDWGGAEALLERSQALWLALGDRRKAFARLRNRAQCWLRLGRANDARACFEHCAREAREDDDTVGRVDSLLSLSSLLTAGRQWAQALQIDRECVRLCWQDWHRHGLAYALWNPPLALARLRKPTQALRLMAFAATFWECSFGPLAVADRHTVRRVRRLASAQLGAAAVEALWAEGATMSIAQAVALALQDDDPRHPRNAAISGEAG